MHGFCNQNDGGITEKGKALVDTITDALAFQPDIAPAIRCGTTSGMSWSGSTRTSPTYTAPSLSRGSSRRSKTVSVRRNDCVRSWSRIGPCQRTPRNRAERTAPLRSFPPPPLTHPVSPLQSGLVPQQLCPQLKDWNDDLRAWAETHARSMEMGGLR